MNKLKFFSVIFSVLFLSGSLVNNLFASPAGDKWEISSVKAPSSRSIKANIGGCEVSIKAKNSAKSGQILITGFQVRIKGGTWKYQVTSGYIIKAGETVNFTVNLDFGCDINRQYLIHLTAEDSKGVQSGDYDYYYPSATSWTKKTTINLGVVSRFFN